MWSGLLPTSVGFLNPYSADFTCSRTVLFRSFSHRLSASQEAALISKMIQVIVSTFLKVLTVTIEELDQPLPEAYYHLIGEELTSKTWVFDRESTNWWYMLSGGPGPPNPHAVCGMHLNAAPPATREGRWFSIWTVRQITPTIPTKMVNLQARAPSVSIALSPSSTLVAALIFSVLRGHPM